MSALGQGQTFSRVNVGSAVARILEEATCWFCREVSRLVAGSLRDASRSGAKHSAIFGIWLELHKMEKHIVNWH